MSPSLSAIADPCSPITTRNSYFSLRGKRRTFEVGRYVLMPDHLHLFCAPATFPATSLKDWIAYWRAEATRNWPRQDQKPIWQKDFFDRQLRDGESYHQKWNYVWQNPAVAAYVEDPKEWPFQGELNSLHWHEPA